MIPMNLLKALRYHRTDTLNNPVKTVHMLRVCLELITGKNKTVEQKVVPQKKDYGTSTIK